MEDIGISTSWIMLLLASGLVCAYLTMKLGDVFQSIGNSAGTRKAHVIGLLLFFFVINILPEFFGLDPPIEMAKIWAVIHNPYDTLRDMVVGQSDNVLTSFEIKRVVYILIPSFIIILYVYRGHKKSILFTLVLLGGLLFRLASVTEITPLPGEVPLEMVAIYDEEGSSESDSPFLEPSQPRPEKQTSFLDRAIKSFMTKWKSILAVSIASIILLVGLIKLSPKDWGSVLGNIFLLVPVVGLVWFSYVSGINPGLLIFLVILGIIFWSIMPRKDNNKKEEVEVEEGEED